MDILVCGGSRGLGADLVVHRLGRGDRVATFARTETPLVRDLAAEHPDRFLFRTVDATDYAALDDYVGHIEERWGGLDTLVNNAAIGQDSLLAHTSPERIGDIVRTNLEAPIVLTRRVVRGMLRTGRQGHVVFVGSVGARQGYAGLTVYAATKGALESLTRALARELAGRVLVNTVAPGFFESEMSSVLLPEQRDAIVRRTPTGRLVSPTDVLDVVDLLLGGANVNGTVVQVDGGATA